jgi:glutamine amidotransferase
VIAVVDYGVNNLRSVVRAVEAAGHRATLTADPGVVRGAERVLVPGVGHFGRAARTLRESGLGAAVREVAAAGRPVLGICLGLQLFFARSEEAPGVDGLGLLPGEVRRFNTDLPVPHVGWAKVELTDAGKRHPLVAASEAAEGLFYYHVHSYHPAAVPVEAVLLEGDYGGRFPTFIAQGNVAGAQFHPEKSQRAGIELIGRFLEWRP